MGSTATVKRYLDESGEDIVPHDGMTLPAGYALLKTKKADKPKKVASVKELKAQAEKLKPITPPTGYVLQAYKPTVLDQLRNSVANSAIGYSIEQTMPALADALNLHPSEVIGSQDYDRHTQQLLAPEYLAPVVHELAEEVRGYKGAGTTPNVVHDPAAKPTANEQRVVGALTAAGDLTSGKNLALMGGTAVAAGLTAGVINPATAGVLSRLVSGGFTLDMLHGLYQQNKEYRKAVDEGNLDEAHKIQGEMGVTGVMALLTGKHALSSHPFTPVTEPVSRERTNVLHRNGAGEVRQAKGEAPTVWLSPDAWHSIMQQIYPGESSENTNGFNIPRQVLESHANDPQLVAAHPELQELMTKTHQNADRGGVAIGKKRTSIQDNVRVMREELNHTWQRSLADEGKFEDHLDYGIFSYLNRQMPQGMYDHLVQHGYDDYNSPQMVTEAAAKFMGSNPEDFGVSEDEAADFMAKYFDEVALKYGPEALDNLKHVRGIAKAAKEKIYAEHAKGRGTNDGMGDGSANRGNVSGLPERGQGGNTQNIQGSQTSVQGQGGVNDGQVGIPQGRGVSSVEGGGQGSVVAPSQVVENGGQEGVDSAAAGAFGSNPISEGDFVSSSVARTAQGENEQTASGTNEGLANNRTDGSTLQSLSGGGRGGAEQIHRRAGSQDGQVIRHPNGNILEQVDGGWHEHKPDNGGIVFHNQLPEGVQDKVSPVAETLFNREKDKPVWYLKSERLIGEKMRGPMPAQDVSKMLIAGGVKPEEMHWTGLDDFLAAKGKDKVTPQEIKDHLAANNLQIKEVTKGEGGMVFSQPYPTEEALRAAIDGDEMLVKPDGSLRKGLTIRQDGNGWNVHDSTDVGDKTKYGSYVLPGGENYREMLLIGPDSADRAPAGSRAAMGLEPSQDFRSSHWDEPNILAHVRFNERTGPNGEKLLHLEEVQSDAHQQARTKGYRSSDETELNAAKQEHKKRMAALAEADTSYSEAREQTKKATGSGLSSALEAEERAKENVLEAMREERRAANEYESVISRNKNAIPDLPWKKNWHEQALRRMIRHAIDGNYDGISWTPGADQADRYSLAKKVKTLRYYPTSGRLEAYGHDGPRPILNQIVAPEKLPDVIGKEAANKLLSKESGHDPTTAGDTEVKILTGEDDLKVGGEGMKGFYDKIVPDYLNKFGKKYGAKVETTKIPVKGIYENVDWKPEQARIVHRGNQYQVWAPNSRGVDQYRYDFDTKEDAQAYIDSHIEGMGKTKTVQYLPITPEMRKSVGEEGVPLFNREQVKTPEFRNWFGNSKIVDKDNMPLVVYHGTNRDFYEFRKTDQHGDDYVHYFTPSTSYTSSFSKNVGGRTIPAYIRMENPYHTDSSNDVEGAGQYKDWIKELKNKGYDGIIYSKKDDITKGPTGWGDDVPQYVVFDPRQIKSAIGNNGAFDPKDPSILRNREKSPDPDVEHWINYAKNMSFNSEQEARDWTFNKKQKSDEQYGFLFGTNREEKNRAFADSIPIRKEGTKYKIGGKPAVSKERLGSLEPEGNAPAVDWENRDLQDSSSRVNEESILRDYGGVKSGIVYRAYVDPSVLEPKLAEEEDEDGGSYDWESLEMTGGRKPVPPAKIIVNQNGKIKISDGNHRIKYWQEQGFDSIPAWVIDRRKGMKIDDDPAFNRENPSAAGQSSVSSNTEPKGGADKTLEPVGSSTGTAPTTVDVPGLGKLRLEEKNSMYFAYLGDKNIATASLSDDGTYFVSVTVDPEYQRKGVATALYDAVEKHIGHPLRPSPNYQSDGAKKLWEKRTGNIPVQGGTQLKGAPIMIPPVPVQQKKVLPLAEIKAMAAGLNPHKREVRSVRDLMREAKTMMIP